MAVPTVRAVLNCRGSGGFDEVRIHGLGKREGEGHGSGAFAPALKGFATQRNPPRPRSRAHPAEARLARPLAPEARLSDMSTLVEGKNNLTLSENVAWSPRSPSAATESFPTAAAVGRPPTISRS